MSKDGVGNFQFGALKLSVRGLGLYFGGPKLTAALDGLTAVELVAANKEAWKQKRTACAAANRLCNFTTHGSLSYDIASQHHSVADLVCKETWKRICSGVAA